MSADEIKKALECCKNTTIKNCGKCHFYSFHNCTSNLAIETLDLINRLEEENKRLKDTLLRECQAHNEYIFNTMTEIKRLEEAKNAYKDIVDTCEVGTIKEFAEKIFEEIQDAIISNDKAKNERIEKHNVDRYEDDFCIMCDGKIMALGGIRYFIKNLLKEMGVE